MVLSSGKVNNFSQRYCILGKADTSLFTIELGQAGNLLSGPSKKKSCIPNIILGRALPFILRRPYFCKRFGGNNPPLKNTAPSGLLKTTDFR
jgi:hypothetical protein